VARRRRQGGPEDGWRCAECRYVLRAATTPSGHAAGAWHKDRSKMAAAAAVLQYVRSNLGVQPGISPAAD